jgi:hypothetical protein
MKARGGWRLVPVAGEVNAATLPAAPAGGRLAAAERQGAAMRDDRPRAPTYGPPITIPSAYFLGLVAYNAWCDAHRDDPAVDWMELSEAERAMWQRIATKVAEGIRAATEHSHALGNYLPPPRCRAKRRDLYTFLHLLPLGPPPGRNWRRRRRPPLGAGRAMS